MRWEKVAGVPAVDYDDQLVVNDTIRVVVSVEELVDGVAAPFAADDLQVTFKLLDPVIVVPLAATGSGVYEATFQTPDVFGVYTLIFDYQSAPRD